MHGLSDMETNCRISQQLVNDLGHFIGETLQKESLSESAERKRNELFQSLQSHTEKGNDAVKEDDYEDPSAMDMATSEKSYHSSSTLSDDSYKIYLGYNDIRWMKSKTGPLWRKEKGLFGAQWRRYLAAVYCQTLVLYKSEVESKPSDQLNIQGYAARAAPKLQKDPKKKNITFEVVCPGKTYYQFFARTTKDMEQWIAAINQASIRHFDTLLSKPSVALPDSEHEDEGSLNTQFDEEVYDDIDASVTESQPLLPHSTDVEELYNDIEEDIKPETKAKVKEILLPSRVPPPHEEEEEEIYDELDFQNMLPQPPQIVLKPEKHKPPPLPARRPLPSLPKEEPEEEEEEFYDDIETSATNSEAPSLSVEVEETYDDVGVIHHTEIKSTKKSMNHSNTLRKTNNLGQNSSPEIIHVLSISATTQSITNLPENLNYTEEFYDDIGMEETISNSENKSNSNMTHNNNNNTVRETDDVDRSKSSVASHILDKGRIQAEEILDEEIYDDVVQEETLHREKHDNSIKIMDDKNTLNQFKMTTNAGKSPALFENLPKRKEHHTQAGTTNNQNGDLKEGTGAENDTPTRKINPSFLHRKSLSGQGSLHTIFHKMEATEKNINTVKLREHSKIENASIRERSGRFENLKKQVEANLIMGNKSAMGIFPKPYPLCKPLLASAHSSSQTQPHKLPAAFQPETKTQPHKLPVAFQPETNNSTENTSLPKQKMSNKNSKEPPKLPPRRYLNNR